MLVCLARIQIPITIAPMARPVTTFRVRSFWVFFFHCSSSTCRMKCICSRERPSFIGSILVATRAPDSFGVWSAMSAVSEVCEACFTTVPRAAITQMIYGELEASIYTVSRPSACYEICAEHYERHQVLCDVANGKTVQHPNEPQRQLWFLLGDVGWSWRKKRGNSAIFWKRLAKTRFIYFGFPIS